MNIKPSIYLLSFLLLFSVAHGQTDEIKDEVEGLIDSLQTLEAQVLAPKTFEKTMEQYEDAQEAIDDEKRPDKIHEELEETRILALNTVEAVQNAQLNFEKQIDQRRRAIEAEAPRLAPELYEEAEKELINAAKKLESDNVKSAVKTADKAGPLFDQAELRAIKNSLMNDAVLLIARAVEDKAEQFAPATLNKAREARTKADTLLSEDRYERKETIRLISEAEYQARHASQIANTVKAMERDDDDWESLILDYEDEIQRIAKAVGIDRLYFDRGPEKAADSLVAVTGEMGHKIKEALANLKAAETADDPLTMATILEKRVEEILAEKEDLAKAVASQQEELSQLQASHEEVSEALRERKEREAKFEKAQSMITPSEGDVLYNSSNDIVIRLPGLSFDVNKSDITEEHIPLLRKIETILRMFPDARYFVEGHTDTRGNPSTNQRLSEERARAVAQWIRESMILGGDRISAIGYGSDKPVASNKTADGRAKNRRIDIVIMK